MTTLNTRGQLLTAARDLLLGRGVAGFSFQDLADRLKIRKASVHYHFATKSDLIQSLIEEDLVNFQAFSERSKDRSPESRLRSFLKIFRNLAEDGGRLCPLGALAAECSSLSSTCRSRLKELQNAQDRWLRGVLKNGIEGGDFSKNLDPGTDALFIRTSLQGALMVTRMEADPSTMSRLCDHLVKRVLRPSPQNKTKPSRAR